MRPTLSINFWVHDSILLPTGVTSYGTSLQRVHLVPLRLDAP